VHPDDVPDVDRRAFLRRAGLAVGVGAALPLLGAAGGTAAAGVGARAATGSSGSGGGGPDPDELFWAGRFAEAERGYRAILRRHPRDAHANAQVGYVALLSNRFGDAERYLSAAIAAGDDVTSKLRLAECHVRQDRHARAIPLLLEAGEESGPAFAAQYAHLGASPWQVHGAPSTRLPFRTLDPLPSVEASINGGAPQTFLLDTYATLGVSGEVAAAAGLESLGTISGVSGGQTTTVHLGVLDSLRLGDVEVRHVPVNWSDRSQPPLPDGTIPSGVVGTTVFYHFLTTMDYAGQALVLRRRTGHPRDDGSPAESARSGSDRVPLWLAGDHFPCTQGSLLDHEPQMVTLDTGGIGHGIGTTVEVAERVSIPVDYGHPVDQGGTLTYPIAPERMALGRAVRHDVHGFAAAQPTPGLPGPGLSDQLGFDLQANFTHDFFKPFAITFDYTRMHLDIAGDLGPVL
jgi:aspartyl protease/tetratricopeptide repeat protein